MILIPAKKPKLEIFSTPACPYCQMAKDFFKEHKIKYKEHDVSSDAKARDSMVKVSDQLGVPVILIGKRVIVGFDEDVLKKALKIK